MWGIVVLSSRHGAGGVVPTAAGAAMAFPTFSRFFRQFFLVRGYTLKKIVEYGYRIYFGIPKHNVYYLLDTLETWEYYCITGSN